MPELLPLSLVVLAWASILFWMPADALGGNVSRFAEIASARGRPYVDFPVEYPPLATLVASIVGHGSATEIVIRLAMINGAATVASWWLLRTHWSPTVGMWFLWFVLPLQLFMPFQIDAVVVLLVLGGIVLAEGGHEISGGVLVAASILFKLWPVVLVPVFALRRLWPAMMTTIAITAIGAMAWLTVSGTSALGQVTSYRDASGWHIESVFGVMTDVFSDAHVRLESNALRIGTMLPWQIPLLRLATILAVTAAWLLARRRSCDPAGAPALAAVASLLLLSPVASPQYVVWLAPWAAIVAAERQRLDVRILMIGAGVLASLVFAVYWGLRLLFVLEVLAFGRAVCVLGLAMVGFAHELPGRDLASNLDT